MWTLALSQPSKGLNMVLGHTQHSSMFRGVTWGSNWNANFMPVGLGYFDLSSLFSMCNSFHWVLFIFPCCLVKGSSCLHWMISNTFLPQTSSFFNLVYRCSCKHLKFVNCPYSVFFPLTSLTDKVYLLKYLYSICRFCCFLLCRGVDKPRWKQYKRHKLS